MPTFVPLAHTLDAEVARKMGSELVAIYVNPHAVTMVKPSDDKPKEESVVHFLNGETLKVVENFGPVAAKLSFPRGANEAFFREIWFVVCEAVQEEGKRANILSGMLQVFKDSGMNPEDVLGLHEEIDLAVRRFGTGR
jgi:hypothetical protein